MFNPLIILLMIIPALVALIIYGITRFFFPNTEYKITPLELGAQAVMGALLVLVVWSIGNASAHYDTEVLNGSIVSKAPWTFSCPMNTSNPCKNGYDCNCVQVPYDCSTTTTDAKGNTVTVPQTCYRTECDTCYKYEWERNWTVQATLPKYANFDIERVDAQGAVMPRRWEQIEIGDGVSDTHMYKNWVRASADSLFHADKWKEEKYAALIPPYPEQIYDYYKVDRIATVKYHFANEYAWNEELARVLGEVGPKRQMNMIIVIANNVPRDFAPAVRRNWKGFKKNDAILFIGLHDGVVDWGESMSWSKSSMYDIQMRNMVIDYEGRNFNTIDKGEFFAKVKQIAATQYVRRPMKEFEYLKGNIPPPKWVVWTAIALGIIMGLVTSFIFYHVDLDGALFGRSSFNNRYSRY